MNTLHVLALGAFIIAGAHYVRNGPEFFYAGWVLVGIALAYAGRLAERRSLTSTQCAGE